MGDTASPAPTAVPPQPPAEGEFAQWRLGALFLISVLGLFLELLLIRWIGTEIRIFAYLQNTVLVVCFLGLGMGCLDSRRTFSLRSMLVPLLLLSALLAVPTTRIFLGPRITELLGKMGGLEFWGSDESTGWEFIAAAVLGLSLTAGFLYLLWATFVPVGRLLGRLMADDPRPIRAYSVNVAGSLIGIWLFVACSALSLPPVGWFAAFALPALLLLGTGGKSKLGDAAMLAGIVGLGAVAGIEPGWRETHWSPYQKLCVSAREDTIESSIWVRMGTRLPFWDNASGSHLIAVNNVGYQSTVNLQPEYIAAHPEEFRKPEQDGKLPPDLTGYAI
ncbi:MAG: hypothetical protein U0792_09445 [Gemmataceae bacterium]